MTPDPFITRARIGKAVSVLNRRREDPSDGFEEILILLALFVIGFGLGAFILTILKFLTQCMQ